MGGAVIRSRLLSYMYLKFWDRLLIEQLSVLFATPPTFQLQVVKFFQDENR